MTLSRPSACCTLSAEALCERKRKNPNERALIACKRKRSGRGMENTKKYERRRTIRHGDEHFGFCGLYCCTLAWDNA